MARQGVLDMCAGHVCRTMCKAICAGNMARQSVLDMCKVYAWLHGKGFECAASGRWRLYGVMAWKHCGQGQVRKER